MQRERESDTCRALSLFASDCLVLFFFLFRAAFNSCLLLVHAFRCFVKRGHAGGVLQKVGFMDSGQTFQGHGRGTW